MSRPTSKSVTVTVSLKTSTLTGSDVRPRVFLLDILMSSGPDVVSLFDGVLRMLFLAFSLEGTKSDTLVARPVALDIHREHRVGIHCPMNVSADCWLYDVVTHVC